MVHSIAWPQIELMNVRFHTITSDRYKDRPRTRPKPSQPAHLVPAISPKSLVVPRHVLPADEHIWLVPTLEFDGVGQAGQKPLLVVRGAMAHRIEFCKLDDLSSVKEHLELLLVACTASDQSVIGTPA